MTRPRRPLPRLGSSGLVATTLAATLTIACPKAPDTAPAAPAPTLPTPKANALERVQSIFDAYVRAPSTFDRLPHVSRFYVAQGQRADEACRAGSGCLGDRFACLDPLPEKPGAVERAELVGEQPGVSASVRLHLRFGARTSTPTVDVVVEDGDWRIDQVRCPLDGESAH
jgi:hypothetical protein